MGATGSKLFSYWQSGSPSTSGHEDQPTCDPKNVNGHPDESGDEDTQDQDGGNLDGNNDKELDEESEQVTSKASVSKDNHDKEEEFVSSANGAEDAHELKSEEGFKNGFTGPNDDKMDDEDSDEPVVIKVSNGDSQANTLIKEAVRGQEQSSKSSVITKPEYPSVLEQAKAEYVARKNGKNLVLSRSSQLTLESRKRDHSAESEGSNPSYPSNYLNDLPIANRSKRQKSSETDSVSSSRSDRASTEIEQVTPKSAKSRKRRAKPSKKYSNILI